MLSAGESPMWVAQQMGHSDWTMIARVYGRWIPEAAPDAGQKAVRIFAENAGKKAGISAADAGKLMPALEIQSDKNQGLTGGRATFTLWGYKASSAPFYPHIYPQLLRPAADLKIRPAHYTVHCHLGLSHQLR